MILVLLALVALAAAAPPGGEPASSRLQLTNKFPQPEQVVAYYVRRDFQGSYLQGVGARELKEFTQWMRSYEHEVFFVAKGFKVGASRPTKVPNLVHVEVEYDVVDYRDLLGASFPVEKGKMKRVYSLQRDNLKRWRILLPTPRQAVPVVSLAVADGSKARPKAATAPASKK